MSTAHQKIKSCAVIIEGMFYVNLADGQNFVFPVTLTKRLASASDSQRRKIKFLPLTLHWPEIDEDITIESLVELGYSRPMAANSSQLALAV